MTSTHLAKSRYPDRPPKTLIEHTEDVVNAAVRMYGTTTHHTRLGAYWLRFFRLDLDTWPSFHSALLAACLLHDWGKANEEMQQVFEGKRISPLFRHEHLSVLLIGCDGVDHWLRQRADINWDIVFSDSQDRRSFPSTLIEASLMMPPHSTLPS